MNGSVAIPSWAHFSGGWRIARSAKKAASLTRDPRAPKILSGSRSKYR
jgi:hypothetical protein